jgi:alanyl-tRNA synthetase
MQAKEIRAKFLDFFRDKGHEIVASAPMVVKDDPTLMFTNAGMNQFKDFFLGNRRPANQRIADTQKCLRVSGKHNDLEEVGIDTYHHTMFEMLGNWSFGDYFKKEAIAWAWELLTEVYKLPEARIYATVFGGDEGDGLEADAEALEHWKKYLPADRILYGSKKDNFWEMGDTGPCGPCSELHIDLRPEEDRDTTPGKNLVNADHPQVIEIWNLVFIQFNRKADGALHNLPDKHVDTGMGFERLVMAIQGKTSNYDTDIFEPLIAQVEGKAAVQYGKSTAHDIAIRVIVDHIRAVAFTIADGQLPSNTGAGYVIRRILRRAVRYGFNYLKFKEPFLHELVPTLANQFEDAFPELKQQEEFVMKVVKEEEISFLRTLENGLKIFNEALARVANSGAEKPIVSGEVAFKLYDTYGFPIDLTELLAREKGAAVNMVEFNEFMSEQKDRSKSDAAQQKGDWVVLDDRAGSQFVGYETLQVEAQVVQYRQVSDSKQTVFQIVLDKTPFYAESGGQVGDTGYLEANGERVRIIDTQKENELIVHYASKLPADISQKQFCVVDAEKRRLTENNHSATHLLQAALREVLGKHVQQRGSLVNEKLLRFDFSHFAKVSDEEIEQIEHIVNQRIRQNTERDEKRHVAIEDAKSMGAMALFGEKYGDFVRVIAFDPSYSVELCGGTHVPRTGQIGQFKIISESSIAAGVRRIEAITADAAEMFVANNLKLLEEVKSIFNTPKDLLKAVNSTVEEKTKLLKQIEKLQLEKAGELKRQLLGKAKIVHGATTIIEKVNLDSSDVLKKLAFELRNEVEDLVLVLAADINGKPQVSIMIADRLVNKYGLHAGNLVRELASEIRGGGGGQPFYATAGGKDINGLDKVVAKAQASVSEVLA